MVTIKFMKPFEFLSDRELLKLLEQDIVEYSKGTPRIQIIRQIAKVRNSERIRESREMMEKMEESDITI